MKKFLVLLLLVVTFQLYAEKRVVGAGNSYSEFPYIVLVGQIVNVTMFSVTFENTAYETTASNSRIQMMKDYFNHDKDYLSHGMATALKAASVAENGKMRLNFYIDNIWQIFDDDVNTYLKYLPLVYLFSHHVEDLKLPKDMVEELKKHTVDYYLAQPIVQDLMKNMWIAGVFRINPSNSKLVYETARFFDNIEELNNSEWAQEYRIPDIVRSGLTVTMTKAIYIGNEGERHTLDDANLNNSGKKEKNKQLKLDTPKGAPTGKVR